MQIYIDLPAMKFIDTYRNSRHKMSHDTFYCMHGDAKYPEETQYMIDTESIEIVTHLFKTLLPPGEAIFTHTLPVVCGKSPVLPLHCKIIGWRTRLSIHVIQFRILPCIHTMPVYSNGDISFNNDAILMCISGGFFQL